MDFREIKLINININPGISEYGKEKLVSPKKKISVEKKLNIKITIIGKWRYLISKYDNMVK